jgi:chaperonin GroES
MASSTLKPLGDRLVIKPASREETTASGIVLPDTAKEKPQRGTVIAAGDGRRDDDGDRIPMDVKVGDQVIFAKYAGTEFKLDDDDVLILSEKDVLAVIA